jgi:hypothetical protein
MNRDVEVDRAVESLVDNNGENVDTLVSECLSALAAEQVTETADWREMVMDHVRDYVDGDGEEQFNELCTATEEALSEHLQPMVEREVRRLLARREVPTT